jgi:hypothetical protein
MRMPGEHLRARGTFPAKLSGPDGLLLKGHDRSYGVRQGDSAHVLLDKQEVEIGEGFKNPHNVLEFAYRVFYDTCSP